MKLTKIKPNWFLLILPFLMTSSEASHDDDDVRILIVGIRGDSRFSAADLLSGRKDGGQEDREMVKTPVITDEGRRVMLVTGPNLCEEDTERQSFTTALFLSSPGPHAVLMVLNLNDQESEQCDIVGRAQEMLGAEVLQHCIVLLHQNHQERFTGASRGIAGEMINACGGRFYMIRDSEPKPAQAAALVAEIDKLIWLNADGFYSGLKQVLKLQEMSQDVHEENQLLSVLYDTLGGVAGIIGWIFLISLTVIVVHTKGNDKMLNFGAKSAALVLFMVHIRHVLSPDVAIPLNLALASSLITVFTIDRRVIEEFNFSRGSSISNVRDVIGYIMVNIFICLILVPTAVISFPFLQGSALVVGTIISVRSWSDVLIACYTAPGVTIGAFVFCNERIARESPVFALWSFLYCSVGATLSVGLVNVLLVLLVVKMSIILVTLGFTMAYFYYRKETIEALKFLLFILGFSCGCVFIGSVFLIVGLMMSFLRALIQNLISSYLFYVALFLGALLAICKRNP